MISKSPVILEIIHNWPAETFIQRHLQALQAVQIPLLVVARQNAKLIHEYASLGGINECSKVRIMPNFNHLNWAEKLASVRFLTRKSFCRRELNPLSEKVLLGYFERLHPDLIHFHDATLAATMRWLPQALGIPYTLSLRGSDIQVWPYQALDQKDAIISALKGASNIHAVCHDLGCVARELTGSQLKFSTIYTTLPIPDVLSPWTGPKPGEEIRFISSGRLMWRKGFHLSFIAIKRLLDIGEPVKLTIIGVGPDLDHLLYLRKKFGLESNVDLIGKRNYAEIRQLFGQAHAFVQFSVAEGLSNSLVEAMANGIPVFATEVDGTREVIQDGASGFLLPPLQPEKWADILVKVRDAELMHHIRNIAYCQAREVFSPQKHSQDFWHFFQQALNG